MSEFKLQHLVAELLEALGGKNTPEKLVDTLQKSIANNTGKGCSGSQVAIQNYVQRIVEDLQNPEPFLTKLEDLKQKNVDSLAPYVQLLYQVTQDPGVKSLLHKSAKLHGIRTEIPKTEFTKDDLPQVKNRLYKAISKRNTQRDESSSVLNTSLGLPVASTPSMSSWVQRRPTMSWDFSTTSISTIWKTVPPVSQESILIEDLLNVLIGLPSCYIEPEELHDIHGPRSFKINDNVPLPLRELVKQILPVASHYSIIQRYAEEKMRFEFGQVNNALAEAMSQILKEHIIHITQLEDEFRSGNLTLQKLWFFIQKRMQSLGITASIASTISKSNARGGKVLSLLHDNIIGSIGDERTQQRCVNLMEAACVPYMKMLGMWIYRGIISDPISEFLVEDNEVIQKEDMPVDYSADYWDKKYSIRRERVPKFLESVSDIILKAGKYLNVIRQCGKPVKNKIKPIFYKTEEKHYIEAIENAYKFASQTLLDLVVKEKDLIGRLRSVKHYFLLDQGDFIVTFLTLCEKELSKDVTDVIQGRIESLMDLALRLSSATNDPYREDLRTELLPYDLQFQMFKILTIQTNEEQDFRSSCERKKLQVIDSFSFSYEVHWPLSLILNRKSLACYQMIFRHLFYCKYVERMICQVWRSNKVAKKFRHEDAQHYRTAFALRQRMLHCVQNLEYHMMVEVIEPHWCFFLQRIAKVNNVDEILACHCDFLNSCLKDCMLTISPILGTINKLLAICVEFCKFMQRTQRYFVEAELGSLPNSFYESFNQSGITMMEIGENRTLWCGNLSEKVTEELLHELFLQVAPLERVRIPPTDKEGRKANFGFVTLKHEVSVNYAIQLLNGTRLFGRSMSVKLRNSKSNQQHQQVPCGPVPAALYNNYTGPTIPSNLPNLVQMGHLVPLSNQQLNQFLNQYHNGYGGRSWMNSRLDFNSFYTGLFEKMGFNRLKLDSSG